MNYELHTVLGRDKDDKKFEQFNEWLSANIEKLGVQITDDFHCDGSYDFAFQPKSNAYVAEIKTANIEFANEIKTKLNEIGVDEVKMIGICKTI